MSKHCSTGLRRGTERQVLLEDRRRRGGCEPSSEDLQDSLGEPRGDGPSPPHPVHVSAQQGLMGSCRSNHQSQAGSQGLMQTARATSKSRGAA